MTVRELAAETGTSPASVSRFARTLDYRTYSDMRLALGISISRASGEEKATDGRITLDDVEGSIKYVLSHKVKELSQTASLIDSDDFSAVVNLLHNANLVLIAGVGNSINMGVNAAFKLSQVGVRAFCPSTTEAMVSVATSLKENDVLLVISTSGYSSASSTYSTLPRIRTPHHHDHRQPGYAAREACHAYHPSHLARSGHHRNRDRLLAQLDQLRHRAAVPLPDLLLG